MTTRQIAERHAAETLKYETATKIRELLDAARKSLPRCEDGSEWEAAVIELVCEEVGV